MVFYKNGKTGLNGEHSWADAPVLSHLWEVRNVKQGKDGTSRLILRLSLAHAIYVFVCVCVCFPVGHGH